MAVTDSYCNTQSEFSDTNKCREEENPEMLFASPEQGTEKKKTRRKKKIEQESNQETQVEVCANPLVDTEENAETTARNSTPKKKKKKNKNEQSELQLQTYDPISISIGILEPDVTKEEGLRQGADDGDGDLCIKPLLDTPIPIVPQEEKAEATTQNPNPTPKKKKKKKHIQICDPSITLGVEHDVMKEEGAHQGDDNGNKDLCATHEIAVEELPVPDSLPPEDTPRKKKSSRRKKSAETEAKESNDTDNPQQCFVDMEPENKVEKRSEINADESQVCSKPEFVPTSDIASSSDIELRKRAEPIDTKEEHPQACSEPELASPVDLPTAVNLEKKKGAELSEAHAQQPQPCTEHEPAVPGINEECPLPDPTPLEETPWKKKKKKKVENQGSPLHMGKILNQTTNVEKKKGAESSEGHAQQPQPCSEPTVPGMNGECPLPDPTPLEDTPPKNKKKKKVENQGSPLHMDTILNQTTNVEKETGVESSEGHAQQPQPCSEHEPTVPGMNEECPLPDPTSLEDTPRKNKKKKKVENQGSPLYMDTILNQTTNVEKKTVAELSAQQPQPCSEHEPTVPGMNEECPLPDPTPLEDTLRKKKKKKKVENQGSPLHMDIILNQTTNVEKKTGVESSEGHAQQPQPCSEHEPTVPGMNEECPLSDPTSLEDTPRKNKKKKKVENQGSPLYMDTILNQTTNVEKKTGAESIEGHAQQPQPCSEHEPTVLGMNEECPLPDPTPLEDTPRKKKKKKVENQGSPLQIDKILDQTTIQVEQDSTTPICLQPESPTDQTIPVDPAIPTDTEQKTKKRKRKKQRNVLDGEVPNDDKHNTEQPEIPILTSDCLIAAPPIDPAIPVDPYPAIPICPVISTDLEQKMSKKKRKKKRKSEVESEGAEPNERSSKPPEFPVQESIYPIAAPSIDLTIPIDPAPPIHTATPIDQDEKMTKKKRKKKKRSALISEGAESSEHEGKPPEIPVQSFVYPIVAHSIDPTIPDSAPPIDTATSIDQGQSSSKKKRKRSAPISEGAEPSEHDGKLPGTPAQGNTIAAPSIDLTIPSSQAPPVDPVDPVDQEQMTKKKRKKERRSEPKNEGLESEKDNADLTAETPAQETEEPTTKNSMSMYNAEPSEETPVQRTDSLRVTKSPSKMVCRACRQPGHMYLYCQRLKRLSKNEEVCFFCVEIGHSLGKCSASHAGGRFAKCLLCYEHGHFSYDCPRNGHGIDPKPMGPSTEVWKLKGEPDHDQGRPSSEKERTKEIL